MNLPRGGVVRSRVIDDPGEPLGTTLDRGLDGYLVLEPQGSLLLDEKVAGVLTVADGVRVLAYERRGDHGGRAALDALVGPGPFRAELYAVGAAIGRVHDRDDGCLAVTPGVPAERHPDDPALAAQTRERAPYDRLDANDDPGAVESFLVDEERVEAIRERARAETEARAAEWGLTDQLAEPPERTQ